MSTLAYNKRANYDYEITDKYEAGIILFGHEVKSAKNKHVGLKGAYVSTRPGKNGPELYLINSHISLYKKASNIEDYDPGRPRKLLIHKNQMNQIIGKKKEQGLTLVPIKMYTKRSLVKLEFGIGRGKKKVDKRQDIKKRELDRKIRTLTKETFRTK